MNATNVAPLMGSEDGTADATSLEEAFARHQSELLGTLVYLVGNREDARDALQEAFVKCWRHRAQAPEVRNLKAWIFRIALNTGRDVRKAAWRRRREPMPQEERLIASRQEDPQDLADRREQHASIQAVVRELRDEEREVFLLRQNGGLTYEEIAAALDLPTGTVKTRMRLALTRLREALA
jgi:RNA polymerase sigma factor (sigma-70 family)